MEVVRGKVEQINIKDPQQGNYGIFANYGIKVNGAWHNGKVSADKLSGQLIVKDKNYKEVQVGMEVEFVVDETMKDGKTYKNINQKMFEIKGGQAAAQPTVSAAILPPAVTQPPKDTYEATFKNALLWSECLKSAVAAADLLFKSGEVKNPTVESIMALADKFYNKANEQ